MFSIKGQMVNSLGSVGHGVFVPVQKQLQATVDRWAWITAEGGPQGAAKPGHINCKYPPPRPHPQKLLASDVLAEHSAYRVLSSPASPKGAFGDQPCMSTHTCLFWGLI